VKFESVDQGTVAEQKVEVTFAGRSGWKIIDVRGASDSLEVELTQTQRYTGRVAYNLLVRLKDSARAGYFNEQLVLVTNDEDNPRIPIYVAGRVTPAIFAAPDPLRLGDVIHGEKVTKKLMVRGKKPFKILSIQCADEEAFQFTTDDQSSARHIVDVVFNAKRDLGSIKESIHIATDLGQNYTASLTAYATIVPNATESGTAIPAAAAYPTSETLGSTAGDVGSRGADSEIVGGGTSK
jgi:hypothetical protein